MAIEIEGSQLEELTQLDIARTRTVSDIVDAMRLCSFGARMLGEVAHLLAQTIKEGAPPLLLFDSASNAPLSQLLCRMVLKRWFSAMSTPEEYINNSHLHRQSAHIVIVGRFAEKCENDLWDALDARQARPIFINNEGIAKPGQIQDGFYPRVVFSDPRFVMPVLYYTLLERLEGTQTTASALMEHVPQYGGIAEEAAQGARLFTKMVRDPDCTVFLTLSGAMTIAKMGLLVCEMIERGMVQAVSSTGALMAHGLIESTGLKHYKYDPRYGDDVLAKHKLNRVTDTLEPESNFDFLETDVIAKALGEATDPIMSPSIFHRMLGKHLVERYPHERGVLKSAYEKNVPVFTPAFVDSEIGNDVLVYNWLARQHGTKPRIIMDLEKDSDVMIDIMKSAKRLGIFTIGGGVPRNNVQNVAPLMEILSQRAALDLPTRQFSYGVRICPDPMYYGHLSGCTYSEGKSWRKFDLNGEFSEIRADATLVWPFLVKYVIEQCNQS